MPGTVCLGWGQLAAGGRELARGWGRAGARAGWGGRGRAGGVGRCWGFASPGRGGAQPRCRGEGSLCGGVGPRDSMPSWGDPGRWVPSGWAAGGCNQINGGVWEKEPPPLVCVCGGGVLGLTLPSPRDSDKRLRRVGLWGVQQMGFRVQVLGGL